MAGTANVMPAELVAVYDRVQDGDLDAARAAGRGLPAPGRHHVRAVHRGRQDRPGRDRAPRRPVRDPLLPLGPADAARIEQQVAALRPQPART